MRWLTPSSCAAWTAFPRASTSAAVTVAVACLAALPPASSPWLRSARVVRPMPAAACQECAASVLRPPTVNSRARSQLFTSTLSYCNHWVTVNEGHCDHAFTSTRVHTGSATTQSTHTQGEGRGSRVGRLTAPIKSPHPIRPCDLAFTLNRCHPGADPMFGCDLDGPSLRRIAVAADADPRTVAKVLRGEVVKPLAAQRIRRALSELGYAKEPENQPGAGARVKTQIAEG